MSSGEAASNTLDTYDEIVNHQCNRHTPQNRASDPITHVILDPINGGVVILHFRISLPYGQIKKRGRGLDKACNSELLYRHCSKWEGSNGSQRPCGDHSRTP